MHACERVCMYACDAILVRMLCIYVCMCVEAVTCAGLLSRFQPFSSNAFD